MQHAFSDADLESFRLSFKVPWFPIKRLSKVFLRFKSLQLLHSVALDLYDLEHLHYPFALLQSKKPFNSVCCREQQFWASSASSEMLHTFKSEISCNKFPYTHPHFSNYFDFPSNKHYQEFILPSPQPTRLFRICLKQQQTTRTLANCTLLIPWPYV